MEISSISISLLHFSTHTPWTMACSHKLSCHFPERSQASPGDEMTSAWQWVQKTCFSLEESREVLHTSKAWTVAGPFIPSEYIFRYTSMVRCSSNVQAKINLNYSFDLLFLVWIQLFWKRSVKSRSYLTRIIWLLTKLWSCHFEVSPVHQKADYKATKALRISRK